MRVLTLNEKHKTSQSGANIQWRTTPLTVVAAHVVSVRDRNAEHLPGGGSTLRLLNGERLHVEESMATVADLMAGA